jgi:hypothetical protein
MEAILMVLGGLLLGIILSMAILYFFLVILVLPTRESIFNLYQPSLTPKPITPKLPELRDLQLLMEHRQPQPIEARSWDDQAKYLALRADIQADSQPYWRIPSFLRGFMPKSWKEAWQYHESLTYIDDSIPKIISNWDTQEFSRRCTPTLLQSTQREALEQNFADLLGRCGKMTAYQGIRYFGLDNPQENSGWQFVVQADFEHGWAIITGRVIWQGQRCLLDHFSISNAV